VRTLLVKDLRLLAPWAWPIVPGHAIFAANGIFAPEVFFWMNAALACSFTVVLLVIEWRHGGERFVASLPVARADVVKARYGGALGAALVATCLYGLYGHALAAIGGDRLTRIWGGRPAGWESWEGYLAFFVVVSLACSAFLPFHFRLGFGRGSAVFVATALPLLLLAGLVPRWLARGTVEAGAPPLLPSESIQAALAGLSASLGAWITAALALAAVAAVGILSVDLSVRFYDRRDL
jgi:hypothetical protein